jgi:hypothetical protein
MTSNLTSNFDVLLACLLPLTLFVVAVRATGTNSWTWHEILDFMTIRPRKQAVHGPFSLQNAHKSYARYARLSQDEFAIRRASYNTLGRAHKRLANKIGYGAKLDRLADTADLNAVVTSQIAALAEQEFGIKEAYSGSGDLWRVREALKHFIRDWSAEGALERDRIFSPILDVLREVEGDERREKRVLVPGSGLGRLAWEISQLGMFLGFFLNLLYFDAHTFIQDTTRQPTNSPIS